MASELDITNGHAARMRFSRFKQHMEGIPPAPRKPRSEIRPHKKAKVEKNVKREPKRAKDKQGTIKPEPLDFGSLPTISENETMPQIKDEPFIKPEPLAKSFIKPELVIKDEPMDEEPDREVDDDPPAARFADVSISKQSAFPLEKPLGPAHIAEYAPVTTYVEVEVPRFAAAVDTQLFVKREPIDNI